MIQKYIMNHGLVELKIIYIILYIYNILYLFTQSIKEQRYFVPTVFYTKKNLDYNSIQNSNKQTSDIPTKTLRQLHVNLDKKKLKKVKKVVVIKKRLSNFQNSLPSIKIIYNFLYLMKCDNLIGTNNLN